MNAKIFGIYIAKSAGASIQTLASANIFSAKGIEGDRYFTEQGTFSKKLKNNPAVELSLIEKEQIDTFNIDFNQSHNYPDFRRNIVTTGVNLNDLIGKTFTIGDITVKGIRLCEPCTHLAEMVNPLFLPHMVGKAGLRAQILNDGEIAVGDNICI